MGETWELRERGTVRWGFFEVVVVAKSSNSNREKIYFFNLFLFINMLPIQRILIRR